MRRFGSAFAVIVSTAALAVAQDARAQAGCYSLQVELSRLQNDRGNGSARYEEAYREQVRVLARTEADARQAGCFGGGFLFFRTEPARSCRSLVPKIRDMRANLAKLDRLRRSPGSAPSNQRRLNEVKAIMANRGCNAPRAREQTVDEQPWTQRTGAYRTLCVRTCDGYYFPMSFATTRSHFEEDADRCRSLCPGAEAKLFAYSNPGQGPEQMVGLDGRYYADMPTAFRYRTTFDPSCTCKTGDTTVAMSVPGGGQPVPVQDPAPPIPDPRPAPGEDPETIANRMGGFSFGRSSTAIVQASSRPSEGKQVRVVGPAYRDAPEQDGVVLTPVPN